MMRERKVAIRNASGERLVGLETLPAAPSVKAVLLVHGFGVTKSEDGMFDTLAAHLAEAGFTAFRFDFSGCGESDGDYVGTTLSKQRDDLRDMLSFVRERGAGKVGILAQSFGTAVTLALSPEVDAMVLMGSIAHPKEVIAALFGKEYHPEGVSAARRSDGGVTRLGPRFWPDIARLDLIACVARIQCPKLFIHGSADDIVPLGEMEALFTAAPEPKERLILEGADHGLRPKREEMYRAAEQWFTRWL